MKDYINETIWCNMVQIADCSRPLRNIDKAHVTELREAFLTKEFDYSCIMMRVTFVRDMHPEVSTWGDMVTGSENGFALRPDLHVRVVDGRHLYKELRALDALPYENGLPTNAVQWLSEPLLVSAVPCQDREEFTPSEKVKICHSYNISTAILRRDILFVDILRTVISDTDKFKDEYKILFVDARTSSVFS